MYRPQTSTDTDQAELPSPARRYAPLVSTFAFGAAALTQAATRRNREPAGALELLESALATFFIARVVAKEKAGAVVREPFVEQKPDADPTDGAADAQQPVPGVGLRHTIGELVTCTRCLGPWAASAVTFGQALAPQHARVITRVMALAGANTLLQATQSLTQECSNAAARGWLPPTTSDEG